MKLPSINQVFRDSSRTFLRFPFPILDAVVGTVAALEIVDAEMAPGSKYVLNILLAAILGIPFLTALSLAAEKRKLPPVPSIAVQVAGAILLVAYGLVLPYDLTIAPAMHIARFCLLAVGLHLFIAVVPFSRSGEINGFWQYNKSLLLRFLMASLFSLVLFAGLAIALGALQQLFGIDVRPKRYFELFVIIAGVFNTWFFLAGVPENLDELEARTDYPRGLKIFAQYILLPLVIIYLVILYAYAAKIVVQWDWPKGWVSGLILGFATTGILMLLLLHPIREQIENRWIRSLSRWFYLVLLPLVVMLLLAVWRRVGEYGITEGRYIVIALGLWLAAMAIYFLISKGKSIKVLAGSLCVIAFVTSVGPWGMFGVSERNQVARLKEILVRTGILVEDKVHPVSTGLPFRDRRDVSSILSYLSEMHGYGRIRDWFDVPLSAEPDDTRGRGKDPHKVVELMGFAFVDPWQTVEGKVFVLPGDPKTPVESRGYDYLLHERHFSRSDTVVDLKIPGVGLRISGSAASFAFTRVVDGRRTDTLTIQLRPVMTQAAAEYGTSGFKLIPIEKLTLVGENDALKVRLLLWNVQAQDEGGQLAFVSCTADVLLSLKQSR